METIYVLLVILYLSGLCVILVFSLGFMIRAQKNMEVDKNERQRAIRWSAVGSVCAGLSFGLMAFLLPMVAPAIELSTFDKALTALLFGIGMAIALFGGILLSLVFFESITLPARRKKRERSQAKKQD